MGANGLENVIWWGMACGGGGNGELGAPEQGVSALSTAADQQMRVCEQRAGIS